MNELNCLHNINKKYLKVNYGYLNMEFKYSLANNIMTFCSPCNINFFMKLVSLKLMKAAKCIDNIYSSINRSKRYFCMRFVGSPVSDIQFARSDQRNPRYAHISQRVSIFERSFLYCSVGVFSFSADLARASVRVSNSISLFFKYLLRYKWFEICQKKIHVCLQSHKIRSLEKEIPAAVSILCIWLPGC